MKELCLREKELCYLAALEDIPELWGIPDAFRDLTPETAEGELGRLRRSLIAKGLLIESPEEGEMPAPECAELLDAVFCCDLFAAADIQLEKQSRACFYRRGVRLIAAEKAGGNWTFREVPCRELAERLDALVDWSALSGDLPPMRAVLPQKELAQWKEQPGQAAVNALVEAGLNRQAAELVTDGFSCRSAFYAFSFAALNAEGSEVRSLMFLGDGRGTLELSTLVAGDLDHAALEAADPERLRRQLRETAQWAMMPRAEATEDLGGTSNE